MSHVRAFTLLELLVVIGIVAVLAGMLMPMVAISQRSSKRTATLTVLHKVDTAVRLFRSEIGAFPYQLDDTDPFRNHLGYQIGTAITPANLTKVAADARAAEAQYAYTTTSHVEGGVTAFGFRKSNIKPLWVGGTDRRDAATGSQCWNGSATVWRTNPQERLATAATLNRMAGELARLEIFAGNVDVAGLVVPNGVSAAGTPLSPSIGFDRSGSLLLPGAAATSRSCPGFASDYLHGELDGRYRDSANWQILDAYGKPLVYVSRIHNGGRFNRVTMFGSVIQTLDLREYGLQRRGRTGLAPIDPETGKALVAHPDRLPDPANLQHSDRRSYAARGFEYDFELWSAGPDQGFDWMRNSSSNRDNIPCVAYDRSLP